MCLEGLRGSDISIRFHQSTKRNLSPKRYCPHNTCTLLSIVEFKLSSAPQHRWIRSSGADVAIMCWHMPHLPQLFHERSELLTNPNITPIMENQMEKKMENEMETREYIGIMLGVVLGLYWDNGK